MTNMASTVRFLPPNGKARTITANGRFYSCAANGTIDVPPWRRVHPGRQRLGADRRLRHDCAAPGKPLLRPVVPRYHPWDWRGFRWLRVAQPRDRRKRLADPSQPKNRPAFRLAAKRILDDAMRELYPMPTFKPRARSAARDKLQETIDARAEVDSRLAQLQGSIAKLNSQVAAVAPAETALA